MEAGTLTIQPLGFKKLSNLAGLCLKTAEGAYDLTGVLLDPVLGHAYACDRRLLVCLTVKVSGTFRDRILIPAKVWKAFQAKGNKRHLHVTVTDDRAEASLGDTAWSWDVQPVNWPEIGIIMERASAAAEAATFDCGILKNALDSMSSIAVKLTLHEKGHATTLESSDGLCKAWLMPIRD